MALTTSSDILSHTNYETAMSSTTVLQTRTLSCTRETKNLAKKKLLQAHIILKLKKKSLSEDTTSLCYGICSKKTITTPVVIPPAALITTPYPYQLEMSSPVSENDWNPMKTPLFTIQSLPVIIPSPSTIFGTDIYPFGGTVVEPVLTPTIPQSIVQDSAKNVFNYINELNCLSELVDSVTEVNIEDTFVNQEETTIELEEINDLNNNNTESINFEKLETAGDPIEVYLSLPKQLFPTAKATAVDPNAMIDEFCKMPNLHRHAPWLLDLEFGIPRTLITRPLPIYNVKFNSIHCKNTPDAIHPGFESCTPDFKRALMFYYDCVVSAWYRGYMMITCDRSVENFQSWLQVPMQVLGMCWP